MSDWKCENGTFTLHVIIPANTTATVHVPTSNVASITESNQSTAKAEGVQFLRMENDAAVYEVTSGNYTFCSPQPTISVSLER